VELTKEVIVAKSSGKKKGEAESVAPNVDLTPDPVVSKRASDTSTSAKTVTLAGFLGPSDRTNCVRLYLNTDLRTYFEIPKGAILSRERPDAASPDQPTKVVVDTSAKLEFVVSVEASFLQGNIISGQPFSRLDDCCMPLKTTCGVVVIGIKSFPQCDPP
jgi:hypothetical protein